MVPGLLVSVVVVVVDPTNSCDTRSMKPALQRLKASLDGIDEPAWCEGRATCGRLVFESRGDSCATDDPDALVAWLTAHAEPAPFGHQGQTKLDPDVRSTLRVKSRRNTAIIGLDVSAIAERVDEALATRHRVSATLLDVLVYPTGGKFLRHKDTPRDARQLGTLIIEIPIAHDGGALVLQDGDQRATIDWSGKPRDRGALRWVALFGDVDHTITEITSGSRVTLVYTLTLTDQPRTDPGYAARLDAISDAIITLSREDLPEDRTLYIPCTRMIVAPTFGLAGLEMLRGADRAIADTFARCGAIVHVSELLIPTSDRKPKAETERFPDSFYSAIELVQPIPEAILAASALSFTDDAGDDGEGDVEDAVSLEPYLGEWISGGDESWLVRDKAHAKLVYEGIYSETGYFGNEGSDGHIYQCAVMVVGLPNVSVTSTTQRPKSTAVVRRKKLPTDPPSR